MTAYPGIDLIPGDHVVVRGRIGMVVPSESPQAPRRIWVRFRAGEPPSQHAVNELARVDGCALPYNFQILWSSREIGCWAAATVAAAHEAQVELTCIQREVRRQ